MPNTNMSVSLDRPLNTLKTEFPVLGHYFERSLRSSFLARSKRLTSFLDKMPYSQSRDLRQAAVLVWVYFGRFRFNGKPETQAYWNRVGQWAERASERDIRSKIWKLFQNATAPVRGQHKDIAGNSYDSRSQAQEGSCGPACLSIITDQITGLESLSEDQAGCLIRGSQGDERARELNPAYNYQAGGTNDGDLIDVIECLNRKCVYSEADPKKVNQDSIVRVVWQNSGTGHYVVIAKTLRFAGRKLHVVLDPIYGLQYMYPDGTYQPCENDRVIQARLGACIHVPPAVAAKPTRKHRWQRAETSHAGRERNRNKRRAGYFSAVTTATT